MAQEKSRVDELSDTLNSRTLYKAPVDDRTQVEGSELPNVDEGWEDSPDLDRLIAEDRRHAEGHPLMKKLFITALIFFIFAAGAAAYIYFGGGNFISSKNVDIGIVGPTSVSAGETAELAITVTNTNNADLDTASLAITYPEGTRNPEDQTKPLDRFEDELGEIGAGKEISRTSRAVIFGEKGEVKTIHVALEYKVKGSVATFQKAKDYQISIGSSPVGMTVDVPKAVTSGETFTTTITVVPNGRETLQNVLVRGEYPYGFTVIDSNPKPVSGNNLWSIGNLGPDSKKTITIRGQILGENSDERSFRFYTGLASPDDPATFGTNLAVVLETTAIDRPSIGLNMDLNGEDSGTYVAPAGKEIRATVELENNLPIKLQDVRVATRITGSAVDESSIQAGDDGDYSSGSDEIVWNQSSNDKLENLNPGDDARFSFNFSSFSNLSPGTSQIIELTTTVTGKPQGERDPISVTEKRLVKIASTVSLNAEGLYSKGDYKNTGPMPPKANATTTYTVHFTLGDTQNDVDDAKLTAVLGANVIPVNLKSSGEDVAYDEATKKITWDLHTLKSGSGYSLNLREAWIQVGITPSTGQIGSTPILVNNISFSGTDEFTGEPITVPGTTVTTRIDTDPSYVQGNERVVK